MYELVEMGTVAVLAVIGIVMAVAPRAMAKKSLRENRAALIVVRILGVVIVLGAAAVMLMQFGIL